MTRHDWAVLALIGLCAVGSGGLTSVLHHRLTKTAGCVCQEMTGDRGVTILRIPSSDLYGRLPTDRSSRRQRLYHFLPLEPTVEFVEPSDRFQPSR